MLTVTTAISIRPAIGLTRARQIGPEDLNVEGRVTAELVGELQFQHQGEIYEPGEWTVSGGAQLELEGGVSIEIGNWSTGFSGGVAIPVVNTEPQHDHNGADHHDAVVDHQ